MYLIGARGLSYLKKMSIRRSRSRISSFAGDHPSKNLLLPNTNQLIPYTPQRRKTGSVINCVRSRDYVICTILSIHAFKVGWQIIFCRSQLVCLGTLYAVIGGVHSSIKQGKKSNTKWYSNVKKPGPPRIPEGASAHVAPLLSSTSRLDYLDSPDDWQTILPRCALQTCCHVFALLLCSSSTARIDFSFSHAQVALGISHLLNDLPIKHTLQTWLATLSLIRR